MPAPRPSRRARCRADRRRRPGQRSPGAAFTLVELLVAITIIAAVLAIAIGGLFSHKDTNRVLATEQLLADLVRQARHAARSSGEPVELRLLQTTDANGMVIGGRIQGVSRMSVWSQSFDDPVNMQGVTGTFAAKPPVPGDGAIDPDPATGLTMGRTGNGVWPATSTVSAANLTAILVHPLIPAQNIVRGADPQGQADGFYLACAVRPPAAYAAWQSWLNLNPGWTASTATEIPLVMLGGADGPVPTSCIAGLKLVLTHVMNPIAAGQFQNLYFWDLRGWVNLPGSPAPTTVSISAMAANDPSSFGPAWPIGGERWEDLGLLYDGYSLTLVRNGNALHATGAALPMTMPLPTTAAPHVLVAPAQEFVYIGSAQATAAASATYADAPLDDVRLMRLGADQPIDLPPSVVPETPGTLTFRPDGTASFTRDTSLSAPGGTPVLPPLALANPVTTQTSGAIPLAMANGTQKVIPASAPAAGALVFCRWVKGQRENGALQAGLVLVPLGNGPVQSFLGSLGRDGSSPPVTYLVYSSTP